MRTLTLFITILLCTILLITQLTPINAFAPTHGHFDNDAEFQPNPFLSPEQRERAIKKHQKMEANKLIEMPKPTPQRNGPPSDYKFDQELPLTIGDVIPLNTELRGVLHELVHTAFFRYYKVNLHSECPYWAMNRMCTSGGGCNVCECTDDEVPKPWRIDSTDPVANVAEKDVFPEFEQFDDNTKKESLLQNWAVDVWSDAEKEQSDHTATYVNLLENVEGNTGYSGEEPRRIWDSIYNENCFARIGHNNVSDMCFQDRMMYRLISGLHSSISAHVFKNWKLDDDWAYMHNQFLWNMLFTTQQHNIDPVEFAQMVKSEDKDVQAKLKKMIENDNKVLERINNLFFTLEMLLESISTLYNTPIIPFTLGLTEEQVSKSIVINTGDFHQDSHTAKLLTKLVEKAYHRASSYTPTTRAAIAQATAPVPTMHNTFASLDEAHIENMRHLFHNVSIIMNCVGCEKCRIWSKLNILGIATGLKLASSQSTNNTVDLISKLQRNELIALINTVNSFSEAVNFVATLSQITTGLQEVTLTDSAHGDEHSQPKGDKKKTEQQQQKVEPKNDTINKKAKEKKPLDKQHKFIIIIIAVITMGIIVWRQMVQPADTFSQLEKTKTKAIPAQRLDRIQRDLNNATQHLVADPKKTTPASPTGPNGKPKNKKMD